MSEFLLNWFNTTLLFDPPVKSLTEFDNGYKYGELLCYLGLINEDQLDENFIDNDENIESNYSNFQTLLKSTLSMEITNTQIKELIDKQLGANGKLIYKIKSAFEKKLINYDNIKFFDENVQNKNNIEKQIRNLLEGEDNLHINDENNDVVDDLPIMDKTIRVDNSETKKNISNKYVKSSFRMSMVETHLEHADAKKKNSVVKINKEENKQTTNEKKDDINLKSGKILLEPIRKNVSKSMNFDYNEEEFKNSQKKIENFEVNNFTDNLHKIGFEISKPKLNFYNNAINLDMSQETVMLKVREQLKDRLEKKKIENKINEVKLKEKLFKSMNLNKKTYDFINPYNKFLEINNKDSYYHNIFYRLDWNKKYFDAKRLSDYQTRIKKFQDLFKTKQLNFSKSTTDNNDNNSRYTYSDFKDNKETFKNNLKIKTSVDDNIFRKTLFFKNLHKMDLEKSINLTEIKKANKYTDTPLIKNIVYQIIDMSFESFLYQFQNEKELLDLPLYKEWNEKFVNNLPLREPAEDEEMKLIKGNKNKEEEKIDVNDPNVFTEELNDHFLNYVDFVGEWDDKDYITEEERGKLIDYKYVIEKLPEDFEPTNEEINDVTIPNKNYKCFNLANIIKNMINEKYPEKNKNVNDKNVNVWEHIPIKISLIGLPLCGKKTLTKKVTEKYNNIKVYLIENIIEEYEKEWNEINEPIENHPKFKSMKPNQIEQLKEEQNKKIEEFKDKYNLIKPYLDYKKSKEKNKNKESENNENNEEENSESNEEELPENIKDLIDIMYIKILIQTIEKDFTKESKEETENKIIERQSKIISLTETLNKLKEDNQTNKKPNIKEEQNLTNQIESLQNEIYKGFIIIDFPKNLNQSILLEHYLTNYIDVTSIPKTSQQKIIEKFSNNIDFKYKFNNNSNNIINSGLDFIINLN